MDIAWFATALIAFVTTFFLILVLQPLASQVGLVDRPCERKRHHGEVPLIGGIAICLGIITTQLLGSNSMGWDDYVIIAAATLLLFMGIADDYYDLGPKRRLIGQAAAALVVIYGADILLRDFGDLLFTGNIALGFLAVPLTIFCFVGVINATNMVDGLDGLAGGLALVAILALMYLNASAGNAHQALLVHTAGATAGFLILNARSPFLARAKIFMGDSGSMFLGCAIAALLIDLSQGPNRVLAPVTALWIFAIPLMDTVRLMGGRMLRGTSPFTPGRDHLHHILLRSGLSVTQTVAAIVAAAALLAGVGITAQTFGVPEGAMFVAFLSLFAFYTWAITRGWRIVRLNRRRRAHRIRLAYRRQVYSNPYLANLVYSKQARRKQAANQTEANPIANTRT